MTLFLPKNVWQNKRGFPFGKIVNYLDVGFHTGQDFFTSPVGKIPVIAPCDGVLKTFPFSNDAGWWGYYKFDHMGKTYSLRILHMYKQLKDGKYKEGDILGYCGATGFSKTIKYGKFYSGPSHKEQTSKKAVPHLHVELHVGKFKFGTLGSKKLANERLIDPVVNFEKWINEDNSLTNNNMIFYKEKGRGKSAVYIKGLDNKFYPIIKGEQFVLLFGDFKENNIKRVSNVSPKAKSYFGLFKKVAKNKYEVL